jgi:glycosyl transferase family 87
MRLGERSAAESETRARVWARPSGALALVGLALGMWLFMSQAGAMLAGPASASAGTGVNRLREGGDSYVLWFALRAIVEGRDPYSWEVAQQVQTAVWGAADGSHVQVFAYPVSALIWYLPTLWLGLPEAALYARALGLAAAGATVLLGVRVVGVTSVGWPLVAASALLGGMAALYDHYALGQNGALGIALALGAWLLYRGDRYVLAGLLLPLAAVKPQYIAVLALGMALHAASARRRWGFFLGAGLGAMALILGGLAVVPNWPVRWVEAMRQYAAGPPMGYLAVVAGDGFIATWLIPVTLVLAVVVFWWRRRARPADEPWGAVAVVGSLVAGVVAMGVTPGLYSLVGLWPALALLLLGPTTTPPGALGRLTLALNVIWIVLVPLAAGAVGLAWQLAPPVRSAIPFGLLASWIVLASVYQGVVVGLWALERCLPARVRAWEPRPTPGPRATA